MKQLSPLLCALLLLASNLLAQSTAGTEFWLGYQENLNLLFNDAPEFSVIIGADVPTDGAIEVPSTGLSIPFSVPAGATEVFFPDAIFYSQGSEVIDNKGVRIVSDLPVRVQAYHYRVFFTESTNLLPISELGSEYLVTTMLDEDGPSPGSFVVVATADNTEVEITPTTLTLGLRPANIPFTVTLNAGQNYQVQANGELAGTRVRSLGGEPLAVFAGAREANISIPGCQGTADSHVWDQCIPLEDWRDLYYFAPFAGQGGDRLRIMASSDNTEVFFDCERVATLAAGEFLETQREPATVISATGAISVSQYSNGFSCEPQELGDPNGLRYLPADFLGTNFRWYASDRGTDLGAPQFSVHWLTVVGPEENFLGLTVDGAPVTNTQSFPGDPTWRYAYVEVGAGAHQLSAQAEVQAYSYGFGFADAYTNNLGYEVVEPQGFACLEIEREGILCVDSLQTFTYSSNLDFVQFAWAFGDGNGSTEAFPTHVYQLPDTYEVVLTATTADGTVVSDNIFLEIVDCEENPCAPAQANLQLMTTGDGCSFALQDFSFSSAVDAVSVSWDFGDGQGLSTAFNPNYFYGSGGNYTVTLMMTDALGCVFEASLPIEIEECDPCAGSDDFEITISGDLCTGASLTFDPNYATPGIPFFIADWKFSSGEVVNSEIATVTFEEAGAYTANYFAINEFGCQYAGSIEFEIENCAPECDDLPALTLDGPQSVCVLRAEEYFAITTANLVSYDWQVNGISINNTTSFIYSFVLTGPQLITLNAIDDNGCPYTANWKLNVDDCQEPCPDELTITDVVIDGELCVDSTFSITIVAESDEPNFTLWTLSQQELPLGAELDNLVFDSPGSYSFDFITFITNCFIDSTIVVDVVDCSVDCSTFELISIELEGEQCVGANITISPQLEQDFVSAEWTFPDGSTNDGLPLENISFPDAGAVELLLQIVNESGCVIDTSVQLLIEECVPDCSAATLSEVILTGSACVDSTFALTAVSATPPLSSTWTVPDGSTSSGLELTALNFAEAGTVDLRLEVLFAEGCSVDTTLQVLIEDCTPPLDLDCQVMFPNVFSPNNDGLNDEFRAFFALECLPTDFELHIYNRWGGKVYESRDPTAGWRGELRGKAHPSGVLVYWSRMTFPDGAVLERAGDVVLVR